MYHSNDLLLKGAICEAYGDYEQAFRIYQSLQMTDKIATERLAYFYENGIGIQKDE